MVVLGTILLGIHHTPQNMWTAFHKWFFFAKCYVANAAQLANTRWLWSIHSVIHLKPVHVFTQNNNEASLYIIIYDQVCYTLGMALEQRLLYSLLKWYAHVNALTSLSLSLSTPYLLVLLGWLVCLFLVFLLLVLQFHPCSRPVGHDTLLQWPFHY